MSIKVGNYQFEGPYPETSQLDDKSGVYAIIDHRNDGMYYVIDIGESSEVKRRVDNHDRGACWKRNSSGTLKVAVHYTPNLQQAGRRKVEQELRAQYNPPCGKEQ